MAWTRRLSTRGSSPLTRGKLWPVPEGPTPAGLIPAHAGKTTACPAARPAGRAHPRSRGENTYAGEDRNLELGSSPLTRGKLGPGGTEPQRVRLIPAHAGKTPTGTRWTGEPGAHPRSRGENTASGSSWGLGVGSSPLTRGKLENGRTYRVVVGLIPAHAGKTCRGRSWPRRPRAHPRSRGENMKKADAEALKQGSSPLTRGKPRRRSRPPPGRGLIPAHAGKTGRCARSWWCRWAHPRSRGENHRSWQTHSELPGSSPLTRGKPLRNLATALDSGLIPAHAGKTTGSAGRSAPQRAHPRSRGENVHTDENVAFGQGSSPLTRGKRCRVCVGFRPVGLIPAHAGKTWKPATGVASETAHPRSRGENCLPDLLPARILGSSPLTRGKRDAHRAVVLLPGLIPAHAGKTRRLTPARSTSWAHPRSRGENPRGVCTHPRGWGSSPLTRGKH